jgi:hypothetical protein
MAEMSMEMITAPHRPPYNPTLSIEVAISSEIATVDTFSGMQRLPEYGAWKYSEGGYVPVL